MIPASFVHRFVRGTVAADSQFAPTRRKGHTMTLSRVYDGYDAFAPVGPAKQSEDSERFGTFEYSVHRGRLCWSPAVSAMYGYSHDAVQPSFELLVQHAHSEDRARVAEFLQRVVEGRSGSSQHRLVDCAGKQRWVVIVGNPRPDAIRGGTRIRGLVIDITDVVQSGIDVAVAEVASARGGIEQAKGVLRAAYGIGADEAFAMLVQRSQATNIKVREIAGRVIDAVSSGASSGLRVQVDAVLKSAS
jgi:PAS domain S-box-containing protein